MTLPLQRIVSFKGELVQKKALRTKRYIPLAFRTDRGLRFVIAQDLPVIRNMQIGETYVISGRERTLRGQTYLTVRTVRFVNPRITIVRRAAKVVAGLACLGLMFGAINSFMLPHRADDTRNNQAQSDSAAGTKQTTNTQTPQIINKLSGEATDKKDVTSTTPKPVQPATPKPSITTPTSDTTQTAPPTEPPATTEPPTDTPTPTPTPTETPTETPTPTPTQQAQTTQSDSNL